MRRALGIVLAPTVAFLFENSISVLVVRAASRDALPLQRACLAPSAFTGRLPALANETGRCFSCASAGARTSTRDLLSADRLEWLAANWANIDAHYTASFDTNRFGHLLLL